MFHDKDPLGRKAFRAGKCCTRKSLKDPDNRWQAADGAFRCANCKQMVFPTSAMGTVHRNHCPYCLHSLHVDTKPGNRACTCHARMAPIGLTFKHNGYDKYGRRRGGDVMLVHACTGCNTVNINRIAGDDSCHEILAVFDRSFSLSREQREMIETAGIGLLQPHDAEPLHRALFGGRSPH